jgi:hypothetical protein
MTTSRLVIPTSLEYFRTRLSAGRWAVSSGLLSLAESKGFTPRTACKRQPLALAVRPLFNGIGVGVPYQGVALRVAFFIVQQAWTRA